VQLTAADPGRCDWSAVDVRRPGQGEQTRPGRCMCSGDRSGHGTGLLCASDHGGEVLNSVLFEAAQPRQGAVFGVADWDTVEGVKQHRETVACH
jgi:hypothetical protein